VLPDARTGGPRTLPLSAMSTLAAPTSLPTDRVACAHCGLPVPAGLVAADGGRSFCCAGCRGVHESLAECGLDRYYELLAAERERGGDRDARPAAITGRGFEHLDRDEFLAAHARVASDGRLAVEVRLDGLHCAACVWLLEALPRIEPGLLEIRIDLSRSAARIEWDPVRLRLSRVARRLDRLGYQVLPFADADAERRDAAIDRAWFARIGVSAAIASNAMAVAFALYGGILAPMAPGYRLFFQWIAVALALVSLAGPGRLFFRNAIAALRTRTPHMDIPVAFGLFAATASGLVNTALGHDGIYCESVTMLVFLLLTGRFVQYRQQRKARQRVELLTALVPSVARRRISADAIEEVPIEALASGDLVEVPVGEIVPVDGILRSSEGHLELAHLTGESRPQRLVRGEAVWAGAKAIGAAITVETRATGEATRAGRLVALVREAALRRPHLVELADRMSGWFLLAVLAVAAFTFLFWWHLGFAAALSRTVAMLVVTCPCALGLATPLGVVAGIGKAARAGVLVKGGDVLERLSRPGTMVLDKTGTLTGGTLAVTGTRGFAAGDEIDDALRLAAALERTSVHPVAKAIVAAFAGPAGEVESQAETPGGGMTGRVEGREVTIGSPRFLAANGVPLPGAAVAAAAADALRGQSPVAVALDGRCVALVAVGDAIRPDAARTIADLRAAGWRLAMASGDDPRVARHVGREVGLADAEIHGGLTPEAKLALVRDGGLAGPVVMVGDGVNDLAALAAADVGVAVRDGAQSALHVADACLAAGGVRPLLRLVRGSTSTMRAIRTGLGVSIAYNFLGGGLAFAGLVNPLVAAVLMPVSGLTVTALALRMPRFDLDPREGTR
jgi:Cu2+-exporting ATPase